MGWREKIKILAVAKKGIALGFRREVILVKYLIILDFVLKPYPKLIVLENQSRSIFSGFFGKISAEGCRVECVK